MSLINLKMLVIQVIVEMVGKNIIREVYEGNEWKSEIKLLVQTTFDLSL